MATTYSIYSIGRSSSAIIVAWTLANGETGDPFTVGHLTDCTIHAAGTFSGGASLALQGSNDPAVATANWDTLSEPDGTLITGWTAQDIAQVLETPVKFRPNVTSGDGSTAISVWLKLVSNGNISISDMVIKAL